MTVNAFWEAVFIRESTTKQMNLSDQKSYSNDPDTLLSLYRISQLGSSQTTAREAFAAIIDEVDRLFDPMAASISLISPNTGLLDKEYAIGYDCDISELSLHLDKGLEGRAAFMGTTQLVSDVNANPYYVKLIEGVRCKIVSPMISEGQIIGVLDVDHSETDGYKKRDAERLELIAIEATRSLQSIWRLRKLETHSGQLQALIDVGQSVVSKLELNMLWDSITESALKLTRARMATLQLFDRESGTVTLQAVRPVHPDYQDRAKSIDLEESMTSPTIKTRRQVEFTNITTPDYLDLGDAPKMSNITSCLSTPMIYEERVIGVINVFTKKRHRFPNDEKRLLQAFASMSAAAAQNADLYARVFNSEELLRKSERLTTLGLLSAEIAHEIRNPLTVLKLLFGALGLSYPENDPRHKDTKVIKEKINQLEEIVSKVLSFGKAPESLHSRWLVSDLIDDTFLLVRLKMKQQMIDLQFETEEPNLALNVNKGQLQQVFLNLIINAAEAMPDGGKLTVISKSETVEDQHLVAIYFADTGSGIDESIQDRIFDSFLTGKQEGTGLGLSIVKRILRSHHGDISVSQSSDQGTTMRVVLPPA